MAILSNGKFYGFLCSIKETGQKLVNGVNEYVEDFVSGFAGHGWKLWKTVAGFFRLEIDELVVRRTMTVFELLIQKIRAVKGAIAITQANGKIKTATLTEDGTAYLISLEEDDMSFVEHDYFRFQEFNGGQRFYHVEIESVSEGVIRVPASEFTPSVPDMGDEIVQFGNSSHDEKYAGRHSAIYMHADESGQPAMDVMFEIYSKDWTNCVKVRVGGDIPGTDGLKGFYCENGMIKCVDKNKHITYCLHPDGTAELGDGAAVFRPDKSGHIAGGAISWRWNEARQKYVCTMGDVLLSWDNLDDETKENLKGEPGTDGMSVFITYHDSETEPTTPTGNGTSDGWHTDATSTVVWMSQKVTVDAVSGGWGAPIRIKGKDSDMPDWLQDWFTNGTQIGEDFVVSPKFFSGTRNADGKLTGIVQGKDCLTKPDGTKRTGIFALVDNEVVFELDPINRKYLFKGKVNIADGKILLNDDGSGHVANENFKWTKEGRILANIVPFAKVVLLTTAHLVNYDSHKLNLSDIIDKTIVVTSKNSSGAVIPDNAILRVALTLASMYDTEVPNGTILGHIHIINNSRILLTLEAEYSKGIQSMFVFPNSHENYNINIPVIDRYVKVKTGGQLHAYIIKNESGVGNADLVVLNCGDFERANKNLEIGGVTMVSKLDIINKSLSVSAM